MNYHIIPKNNFNIKLCLKLTNEEIKPHISYSLIYYMNDMYNQLIKLQEYDNMTIEYINKIINPFEFIHSTVPGSTISVSKVKPESTIFFELMELFQIFSISDFFSSKSKINIAHLTHNYNSTNYLLDMLREDREDNIVSHSFEFNNIYNTFIKSNVTYKLDLIICEFNYEDYNDTVKYIYNMVLVLLIVIKCQATQGICVIKIDNIFYKPIIDIIFILSGIYDKIYLVKPSISNITKGDRYIICKGFNKDIKLIKQIEDNLIVKLDTILDMSLCISSILENEIPYLFLNKIEESNIIIGQQQLEAYDQIINIFKNKNHEEKIENLKRLHIQKCIQWCEKNQLPHNKFTDKINIFLSLKE